MAKYFNLSFGLRGCYMPDSQYMVMVDSRRELKQELFDQLRHERESEIPYVGLSKAAITKLTVDAWRESQNKRPSIYPYVLPYGLKGNASYGLHVGVATRADYLEWIKNNEG